MLCTYRYTCIHTYIHTYSSIYCTYGYTESWPFTARLCLRPADAPTTLSLSNTFRRGTVKRTTEQIETGENRRRVHTGVYVCVVLCKLLSAYIRCCFTPGHQLYSLSPLVEAGEESSCDQRYHLLDQFPVDHTDWIPKPTSVQPLNITEIHTQYSQLMQPILSLFTIIHNIYLSWHNILLYQEILYCNSSM